MPTESRPTKPVPTEPVQAEIASTTLPFISIMLPIRNEEKFIGETLQQLYQQDYDKNLYEVIIADGESNDSTVLIVQKFSELHPDFNLKILNNPLKRSSAARNLAVKNARGDYILLIDGHVHIPSNSLLSFYGHAAINNNAKVLGRPQPLNPPNINRFQRTLALARSSFLAHSGESFIYSSFEGWTSPISIGVMYHSSIFDEVGFFDESFDAAEDLEFNYRLEKAGLQCYTAPNLTVNYYPRDSLKTLFKQMTRYGYGRALFINKHPERFTLETIIPAGFLVFLCMLPLCLIFGGWILLLWLGISATYTLALTIETLRLSRKTKNISIFFIAPIIFCVHMGMGYGFLTGTYKMVRQRLARKK